MRLMPGFPPGLPGAGHIPFSYRNVTSLSQMPVRNAGHRVIIQNQLLHWLCPRLVRHYLFWRTNSSENSSWQYKCILKNNLNIATPGVPEFLEGRFIGVELRTPLIKGNIRPIMMDNILPVDLQCNISRSEHRHSIYISRLSLNI
jgi:hypothetical protein